MVRIAPAELMGIYSILFTAGYLTHSTYRDPLDCGECFHVTSCEYYVYNKDDQRLSEADHIRFKEKEDEAKAKKAAAKEPRAIASRYLWITLAVVTVVPAVGVVTYHLREDIRKWRQCHCRHQAKCKYGEARHRAPEGADSYIYKDGKYVCPTTGDMVDPVFLPTSTARERSRELSQFERKQTRKKMAEAVPWKMLKSTRRDVL